MSQLITPFVYWNDNPLQGIKATNILVTKNLEKIVIFLENGIIWLFKCINIQEKKKKYIPESCLSGHNCSITAAILSRINIESTSENENCIISVSEDGTIIIWDINDGHCICKKKKTFKGIIKSLLVTNSKKYLICSGYSCDINILAIENLERKQIININNDWIPAMSKKENSKSELILVCESGLMSLLQIDETVLNLVNENNIKDIQTIPNCTQICDSEFDNDLFFMLSKEICVIYSRKYNIDIPIAKILSPNDGQLWCKGVFLSPRTLVLWTLNSKIYVYYMGSRSDLTKVTTSQLSDLNDEYKILLSDNKYHIVVKQEILNKPYQESNNAITVIATFSTTKNLNSIWDKSSIDCVSSSPNEIDIISLQTVNNVSSFVFWSFIIDITPSKYLERNDIDSSQNDNTSDKDTVLKITSSNEIDIENSWILEKCQSSIKVTTITSYSSIFAIAGYDNGQIKIMPIYYPFLYDINNIPETENEVSTLDGHVGRVYSLFVPKKTDPKGKTILFSSGIDASVIIWDLETGNQLLKYNEYSRPVIQFTQISKEDNTFSNCAIAFSEDNSVSIFNLEKLECTYHFNGQLSEISRIAWKKNSNYMYIQCVDLTVYIWQIKSCNLDRIITEPEYSRILMKTCDIFIKYEPFNTDYSKLNNKQTVSIFPIYSKPHGNIPMIVIYVNIKQLINEINNDHRINGNSIKYPKMNKNKKVITSSERIDTYNKPIKSSHENKTNKQNNISFLSKISNTKIMKIHDKKIIVNIYKKFIQMLFSSLLTWEVDSELDTMCDLKLGLRPSNKNITIGIKGLDNLLSLLSPFNNKNQIWKVSPMYTASRLIKILSCAPSFLSEKGVEDEIISIITHYGIMLPSLVGSDYYYPSFSHLTKYWQDSTNDIQQAARCLYRSTLSKITDIELNKILSYWTPQLMSENPEKLSKNNLRAAIILGIIGADENNTLKARHTLCNEIAKALLLIIENKTSIQHRIAAIELMGKGFLVWEPYINGSAVFRRLMSLTNLGLNQTPRNTPPGSPLPVHSSQTTNNSQSGGGKAQLATKLLSNNTSISLSMTDISKNTNALGNISINHNNRNLNSSININNSVNNVTQGGLKTNSESNISSNNPAINQGNLQSISNVIHTVPPAMAIMARQAILHIATTNTPLFITTLTFDLMHSKIVTERQAGLHLLSMFVNKRPLIIYPYLSKIVEAVVKSLDPNIPNMRENMIQSVTLSLHDLVKKFPNIAFHGASQRLAIGSVEGLIFIYDLKTGTRWQILDGHQKTVTAVSFSPDGKLLASYSMEESSVRIWQPSPSFLGLLVGSFNSNNDGANNVMKSIRTYSVGTDIRGGDSSVSVPLNTVIDNVRFEWTSENKVKLIGLRGSAMAVSV